MTFTSNPRLAPIYEYFEKFGPERLNGLDSRYFLPLNEHEKEEAWDFLSDRFALSPERINALYNLDEKRAVEAFKKEISAPMPTSPYPAKRRGIEECRLLMLGYINQVQPDEKYITAMTAFARSEFSPVRAQFAQSLPTQHLTAAPIDALKGMIFTETERLPLASAITKFMAIHGIDAEKEDAESDSIYMSLRSDNPKEKMAAIKRLEDMIGHD